ncbi:hypothetical protein LJC64_02805 [Ruminococcaceae bacterium OttesenSCG-928-A11]|nr:hypothetical protein [Ruminococcaceae bacterium OttesenSCG-928-A11]
MTNDELREDLKRQQFIANNGQVLRTLNLLDFKERLVYNIYYIMRDVQPADLLNSLIYLSEAGYIEIQHKDGPGCIGEHPLSCRVPVSITRTGIELLMGLAENPAVEV